MTRPPNTTLLTSADAGFVDIQSATTLVHDSHCVLLLRRPAEDVGSVESPSRALQPDLGIAHSWPKADNSWSHCNVQIKLVNGLAVATAAPHLNDLRAARWRKLTLSNSQAIPDPLFMIRGVAKTWG